MPWKYEHLTVRVQKWSLFHRMYIILCVSTVQFAWKKEHQHQCLSFNFDRKQSTRVDYQNVNLCFFSLYTNNVKKIIFLFHYTNPSYIKIRNVFVTNVYSSEISFFYQFLRVLWLFAWKKYLLSHDVQCAK